MNDQLNTLNTYFWNVGNDIADIRLLAEGLCPSMKVTQNPYIGWV